jgi:hypothetical protein
MRSAVTQRAVWIAALTIGALLLLSRLDGVRLWQDEAETALLGRNTLRYGVPVVWDGRNLVAQYYSLDFERHLLHQKGWLPSYLVAASFALFDESTASARLPFAILGLAALWLCRRLALRLTGDPAPATLALFLLSTSLPFLLYSRQCRWYALAMVLTLLLFEAEDRLEEHLGWVRFGLVVSALFHTNSLVCATSVAGILVARLVTRGRSSANRDLWLALALASALSLPFALVFPAFGFAAQSSQLDGYPQRLAWVLADFNRWVLPIPGLAVLLLLSRGAPLRAAYYRRLLLAGAIAVALSVVPMWKGLVDIIGFRYAVNFLPVGAILFAAALRALPLRPWLPAGVVALHLGTHVLGFPLSRMAGPRADAIVRTDLLDHVGSLLRPVKGPIDTAVEYLAPRVRPGDYLFTPYEQLPFQFYLPVRTVGLQGAAATLRTLGIQLPAYVSDIYPDQIDWYVPRESWNGFLGAPATEQLLSGLAERGVLFERHPLPGPDTAWQTREYPPLCLFHPPRQAPRLVVYGRLGPATSK